MKQFAIVMFLLAGLSLIMPACTSNNTKTTSIFSDNSTVTAQTSTSARPSPSDMVPRVTIDYLYRRMQEKADILIIDARAGVETLYDEDHIKGAIPVPLSKFTEGWSPAVPLDTEIVIYCT